MNSHKTTTALLIGMAVGVAVWSATHHGGVLTFGLLGLAVVVGYGPHTPASASKPK